MGHFKKQFKGKRRTALTFLKKSVLKWQIIFRGSGFFPNRHLLYPPVSGNKQKNGAKHLTLFTCTNIEKMRSK